MSECMQRTEFIRVREDDVERKRAEGWHFAGWIAGAHGEMLALMEREA